LQRMWQSKTDHVLTLTDDNAVTAVLWHIDVQLGVLHFYSFLGCHFESLVS